MADWSKKFDSNRIGVANNARLTPDRPAFIVGKNKVSFAQMDGAIISLAKVLTYLGMKPGDHIAALFHNTHEHYMLWAAAGLLKVTSLVINYNLKKSELAYILDDSQCKLLMYDYDFEDVVKEMNKELTHVNPIRVCSGAPKNVDKIHLENLMEKAAASELQIYTQSGVVPPTLTYTSGTTGRPKGVFRSGANRRDYLFLLAHTFGCGHDDVHIIAGPLYHSAPFAFGAMSFLLGNTIIIMPKFNAEEFLHLVSERNITTTFMVPTMMHRILNLPENTRNKYNISSLRSIVIAGEPFPFSMKKRCVEYFGDGKVFEFYGGTELGIATFIPPEDQLRKPGSCGKAIVDEIDIKILDDEMNEVPVGEVGILYINSPYLLEGYHNNPEATAANFHNGYFTVGDMGYVDQDGYYYIVDRAVDMIISGGVNIYPAEIEEVLYRHKDIRAAAVIGAPDPQWGEKIIAYVVLKNNSEMDAEQIIKYVGDNLATYKKPKEVIFVDELPTSATGKVLKREVKQIYLSC